MKQKLLFAFAVIFAAASSFNAKAQDDWSQATACPGWNNPASFQAGDAYNYYQGRLGIRNEVVPNVLTSETGMTFSGTTYTRAQLATVLNGGNSSCSTTPTGYSNTVNNAFVIMEGSGTDPNTGRGSHAPLPLVPTMFNTDEAGIINTDLTRSIRIGDVCGGAKAAAMYYNVRPTPQNALFYIYYACVIEAPGHGVGCDPTFIIRVMRQNASGQWVQISDTLAYYVTSTPAQNQPAGYPTAPNPYGSPYGTVVLGQNGWDMHGNSWSSGNYIWKDWSKVALNLTNYIYDNLRIEVLVSDCCYSAHAAYAYIAGECRPMSINVVSQDSTPNILMAPRGMLDYEWYASEFGAFESFDEFNPGQANGYVTWRSLRAPGTPSFDPNGFDHYIQPSDFHITKRLVNGIPVAVDSMGSTQTFRCRMTSALDPAKPFDCYLHVNAQVPASSDYQISVLSADNTMGTTTGGGIYSYGDSATLTAIPNTGYQFSQWQDGNTANPRTIVVTHNATYTAYFHLNNYTVTVLTNDTSQGTVAGGGIFPYGSTADLFAYTQQGHSFMGWSDGDGSNPRSLQVTQDSTVTAYFNFTPDTVTVIDTVYIHDTIYISQDGIDDVTGAPAKIYQSNSQVVVEGANGQSVTLFDSAGRVLATKRDDHTPLHFDIPASGTYLIKIGQYPARRVVVIR